MPFMYGKGKFPKNFPASHVSPVPACLVLSVYAEHMGHATEHGDAYVQMMTVLDIMA